MLSLPRSLAFGLGLYAALACAGIEELPSVNRSPYADAPHAQFSDGPLCRVFPDGNTEICYQQKSFAVGTTADSVAVGDADGDGLSDLALVSSGPDQLEVLMAVASETVRVAAVELPGAGQGVTFADLDEDGHQDLAVGYFDWENKDWFVVGVFADGAGGFVLGKPTKVGRGPLSLSAGDLDDGPGDEVVLTSALGKSVQVMRVSREGAEVLQRFGTKFEPTAGAVADLNRDGLTDLVVTEARKGESGQLLVYEGMGGGKWEGKPPQKTAMDPNNLAVGQFDGDLLPDLAVVSDIRKGQLQLALGRFQYELDAVSAHEVAFPHSVAAGELDGDGSSDLAVVAGGTSDVLLFPGNGDGDFGQPLRWPHQVLDAVDVEFGDLDGEGRLDVVVLGHEGQLEILLAR